MVKLALSNIIPSKLPASSNNSKDLAPISCIIILSGVLVEMLLLEVHYNSNKPSNNKPSSSRRLSSNNSKKLFRGYSKLFHSADLSHKGIKCLELLRWDKRDNSPF